MLQQKLLKFSNKMLETFNSQKSNINIVNGLGLQKKFDNQWDIKTKTDKAYKEYKRFRNRLTHIKETAKASYYKEELSNCGKYKSWKIINKLLRKKINSLPTNIQFNGKCVDDPFQIYNCLINIFVVLEKIWRKRSLKFHPIT